MKVEVVTKEDLQELRMQIVGDIRDLFKQKGLGAEDDIRGYKAADVRYLLGCKHGKLRSLRFAGRIRTKKIGGTVYYNKEDVKKLLTSGF